MKSGDDRSFGWWYFQHVSDEFAIVVTVQATNILGGGRGSPRMSVHFYDVGGTARESWAVPIDRISLAEDGRLSVDDIVAEQEDGLRIRVGTAALSLDIRMGRSCGPWGPVDGEIASSHGGARSARWQVRLPHGPSRAWIAFAGAEHRAAGHAYHDRNWGTLPMSEAFRRWSWATVVIADSTLVAARLVHSSGEVRTHSNGRWEELAEWLARSEAQGAAHSADAEGARHFREAFGYDGYARPARLVKAKSYVEPAASAEYHRWLLVGTDQGRARICGVAESAVLQGSSEERP
ncbi:hypothetical protein K7640_08225 [Micromonospora sp. PLK6-60]|uniref:hypothetical protein n=1 Tax=Micromonospora sp. PLK6-60 TaxID=2873383 RepID=UPI001CA75120|nr:hypothetical protein [Micromonospora sp. PLK6-60]MBY8871825.1 hypothetical protein [Micromonospora sp. PLK6-60]